MKRHTVELLVVDEPGVMSRITGMFARRGYNIDTISVGKTHKPGVSKILFTVLANDKRITQVERQCQKLIDVISIRELPEETSVHSEMCLVKVNTKKFSDNDIDKLQKQHKIKVFEKENGHVIVGIVNKPNKIDEILKEIKGIEDISRTGEFAIHR